MFKSTLMDATHWNKLYMYINISSVKTEIMFTQSIRYIGIVRRGRELWLF